MFTFLWLAAAAASFPNFAVAQVKGNVSQEDSEGLLNGNARSLVLFTSQYTSGPQSFTTIFKSADKDSGTRFITIDCDVEEAFCHQHDVNSYPTIRLFELGEDGHKTDTTRYRGPKTARAISRWVKRRELEVITDIDGVGVEEFSQSDDIVIVAHLPSQDETLLNAFTTLASQQHYDYVFGYTTDPSVAKEQGLAIPSVKVFKNIDKDHRSFSGAFTTTSLSSFLATAVPPVIRTFREKDLEIFMQRDKLTLYIFVSTDRPHATTIRKDLTPLAKKYEKYVTFTLADAHKHAEMASNFLAKLDASDEFDETKISIVVHAPLNDNVFMYALGKKIEAESVEAMLKTILQGKAKSGDVFEKENEDLNEEQMNKHNEL